MKDLSFLKENWLIKETRPVNKAFPQKKKRNYLHFDYCESPTHAWKYTSSPKEVARHPFYPLIKKQIAERKLKVGQLLTIKNKVRDVYYASHSDAHIFSWYSTLLDHLYEQELKEKSLEQGVLAYRSGIGSNLDFAKEAFDLIQAKKDCAVICLDITSFFDSLDHSHLLKMWKKLLKKKKLPEDHWKIYRALTKYHYIEEEILFSVLKIKKGKRDNKKIQKLCSLEEFREEVRPRIKFHKEKYGIAQGTPISSVLSNIYMLSFDQSFEKFIKKLNGHYRRYSDDILIICSEKDIRKVLNNASKKLRSINLEVNKDKTNIFNCMEINDTLQVICTDKNKKAPLQYLGFTFDGEKTLLRSATIGRFYRRMKRSVKSAEHWAKKSSSKFIKQKKLYRNFILFGQGKFTDYVKRSDRSINNSSILKQLKKVCL